MARKRNSFKKNVGTETVINIETWGDLKCHRKDIKLSTPDIDFSNYEPSTCIMTTSIEVFLSVEENGKEKHYLATQNFEFRGNQISKYLSKIQRATRDLVNEMGVYKIFFNTKFYLFDYN